MLNYHIEFLAFLLKAKSKDALYDMVYHGGSSHGYLVMEGCGSNDKKFTHTALGFSFGSSSVPKLYYSERNPSTSTFKNFLEVDEVRSISPERNMNITSDQYSVLQSILCKLKHCNASDLKLDSRLDKKITLQNLINGYSKKIHTYKLYSGTDLIVPDPHGGKFTIKIEHGSLSLHHSSKDGKIELCSIYEDVLTRWMGDQWSFLALNEKLEALYNLVKIVISLSRGDASASFLGGDKYQISSEKNSIFGWF